MSFDELVNAVLSVLERDGRAAYRVLKRRLDLDDEDIEDIKAELIDARRVAHDEDGKVLVHTSGGETRSVPGAAAQPATSIPEHADRRLITVMFCDIVGSTQLSGRFDAEELRELIRDYQVICADVVSRCEGHVAQYLGDGLLVYFGYPSALEDEAGRAVQAALDILDALRHATSLIARLGAPMQVRIGIHTGPVVVGEMGGANRHERLALGETPNIAARVQGAARPDEILITAATHRLVDGLYECELHGPHNLKGVAEPVRLYTVRGEGAPVNRFEVALSTGSLTPFVGRKQELELLRQHWSQALAGQGQVVLLNGEAGIGKSRLVQEFRKDLGEDARQIVLRCSPNHQNSAYYPVIQLLRRIFAIETDDSDTVRLGKLRAALAEYTFADDEAQALLASLLDIPHPAGQRIDALEPAERKTSLFDALIEWLLEESSARPLYMIWDDVHWMDPSSHELLDQYLDHVPSNRALIVLAYRSNFVPPWGAREYLRSLSIQRLPEADADQLILDTAEDDTLPLPLREHIQAKTDGIPLYIEELTKTILETDLPERLEAGEPLADLLVRAIPETLQDSLEARLDHCPQGKHVAQWGAVIGREFAYDLLAALIDDSNLLNQGLSELIGAELIYRSGTRASPTYIFKHALVRDTAYESLLVKHRRRYHAAIGRVLTADFPDVADAEPELVANHFAEGGKPERAIELLQSAAKREIQRSAGRVAQGHLQQALRIISTLPDNADRAHAEIRCHLLLGPLISASQGNAHPDVEATYQRAVRLCEQTRDTGSIFPAYFGLRAHYLTKSDLNAAHTIGEALFRAAQTNGVAGNKLEAHVALASSFFFRGDVQKVEQHAREGFQYYQRDKHARHAYLYGVDPGSLCLIRHAQAAWQLGRPEQAAALMDQALELVSGIEHPVSQSFIHDNASVLCSWLQRFDDAVAQANRSIDLAAKYGITFGQGWGLVQRGHARVCGGDDAGGLADIDAGMNTLATAGSGATFRSQLIYPWFVVLQADALGRTGDAERGLALLPEIIALIEKSGARYPEPVLYAVRGELLNLLGLYAEAQKSLRRALAICDERMALGFALSTAASLLRLAGQAGQVGDEKSLLESTMAQFSEGRDGVAFRAAEAMLLQYGA